MNRTRNHDRSRNLSQLLLHLIQWRLFLPLLAVWFFAIGGVVYLGLKTLENQQQKTAQLIARMVDSHLEQGGRILDAVSRVAEERAPKDINAFMESTWKAYQHFETIYYLDKNSRIQLLVPFDPSYVGLDMSRLSEIQKDVKNNQVVVSKPFISLRTGEPTVYLTRQLSSGGRIIGELNLGAFQDEIARLSGPSENGSISILDQSGTLLAHPDVKQVKQQANLDALKILLNAKDGATVIYKFSGTRVLGSVVKVNRVGWTVVHQIPIPILLGPYAMTLGATLMVSLGIWLILMWNLQKKLDLNVVAPLLQLSHSTDAIVVGDYSQVNSLATIPPTFNELKKLADDFLNMSNELQANQAALMKAQKELVRKEKLAVLGQLSGSVGHELRNPLGVMNNAIYLLKIVLADADGKTKEYLDIIKQEIDNSLRIITDLLDFARIKPPRKNTVNIRALIETSLKKCSPPENVSILTDIPENLPLLRTDQQQMEQVLQNLITNGIQAMQEKGGMLTIQTEHMLKVGMFRIRVMDNGSGITPENMKKIFQPLFTTKTKGIGLGLVVCKNLVEANGGRIEVESEPDKGTAFSLFLPVESETV